jgi:plasmid maintenance system antidote protein VapI
VNQLGFPSEVTAQEVARESSLGGAISLCAKAAGMTPKQVQDALKADRAQFSRWTDDKEGILWSKLTALMDACGNDAPLLWMLQQRNYDLSSLRHAESELERQLREANERIKEMEHERDVERRLFRDLRIAV